MLLKFKKRNPLETYELKRKLEGPIFLYGKIGGGKSVSMKTIAESYHDNYNYKIIDLNGGERCEGLYWCIPCKDKSYTSKLYRIGKLKEDFPKQYKVRLLYPYFQSKLPRKLPKKLNDNGEYIIKSILFTIPLKTIDIDDISPVIGVPSESSKAVWNEILYNCKKTTTGKDLIEICKKLKRVNDTPIYKNFIIPMNRESFIQDNNCDTNLDFIEELNDRETISVLCLEFVPKQFHIFILNYFCRFMVKLIDENKIYKNNLCLIREAAMYFRATDDAVLEDKYKIFRGNMSNYIRMGRRGMYFVLDCQSSAETKSLVQGSDDYTFMFKTTSWRDKEEMCQSYKSDKKMRNDQISDLSFLDKGECYVASTDEKYVKKIKFRLPRTEFWKKEYGNFYKNVWNKYEGEWELTNKTREYLKGYDIKNITVEKKGDKLVITEIKQLEADISQDVKSANVLEKHSLFYTDLTPDNKLQSEEHFELPEEPKEEIKEVYIKKKRPICVLND